MKPYAPSKPDPVFDVTKMSAQEIGAELARLTSTFSQARQQPETPPAGNLARSLVPSPAMLEARAAFLPPAASNPLQPAEIVRAGRLPDGFGSDSSANGRARAADPDFGGPEEIDLADINLEELGFMAYAVPRVKTARRARSSQAQARRVISVVASRIRDLARLPLRPHLRRSAILGSAALVLVMTAGSWAAFRQFRDAGAPDRSAVTIASNPVPPTPATEETGALAPLAVVSAMTAPRKDVAGNISRSKASIEETALPDTPLLMIAPLDSASPGIALPETGSTALAVAELSPTSRQVAALATDPVDNVSEAPVPPVIAAPQPQSTAGKVQLAAAARPSASPEQESGAFAALFRFMASAGSTVTIEPAVLLLANATEPATSDQAVADTDKPLMAGNGDRQEGRPLQITAARPSSATSATSVAGGTAIKAAGGASAKASGDASAGSAGGGSNVGSSPGGNSSGSDAGKAGPSKNGASKSTPGGSAGSGGDGPSDPKSKGGSKDNGSSGKDKGSGGKDKGGKDKGGNKGGGKGEGKGGSKGGAKGGN